MFPVAINIVFSLCFGYVLPVGIDYSTEQEVIDFNLNQENGTSLSDWYNITAPPYEGEHDGGRTINNEYDDKNKISNGVVGPPSEDEEVDREQEDVRLTDILEETDSFSDERFCSPHKENTIIVVYDASVGAFTEEQAINDTNRLVFPGLYRVNTHLTVRACVFVYSITAEEMAHKFLELSEIQDIPYNKPFIVGLTPRVFIKTQLYNKNKYNITAFENFTHADFINARSIYNNIKDFHYQILYATATISILGNLLICTVIIKYKTMRNSPNMYAFNLSIADIVVFTTILVIILAPPKEKTSILEGFMWTFIFILFSTGKAVNIWTTVGITVDRYIAICHPFIARTISTQSKAVKINISIWIVFFFHSFFYELYRSLYNVGFNAPGMDILGVIFSQTTILLLFVVLPIFIIIVMYVFIVRSIWKSSKLKGSSNTRGQSTTGKSLKLSVAIVGQFFICIVPIHTYYYFESFLKVNGIDTAYTEMIKLVFLITYLLASAMDPLLYGLVSKRFRETFKDFLCLGWIRR